MNPISPNAPRPLGSPGTPVAINTTATAIDRVTACAKALGFLQLRKKVPKAKTHLLIATLLLLTQDATTAEKQTTGWHAPPEKQSEGRFWRYHWYERGLENGNPAFSRRLRVNSPGIVLHNAFGRRSESRENGMMLIRAEEDLFQIDVAELYFEMWGGHPHTANKRITINGRSTYFLPRIGTEEGYCTYSYPYIRVKPTDLVNGYDAIQWAVDQGNSFWGHMLIDNGAVRVALKSDHTDLKEADLANFEAWVDVEELPNHGGFALTVAVPEQYKDRIERVDFHGWYYGYDENGDTQSQDWHGFTKARKPVAHIGSAIPPHMTANWDTTLITAQEDVGVRAVVRFKNHPRLVFLTRATTGLKIKRRADLDVVLLSTRDAPIPFWSRAENLKTCSIDLAIDPESISRAELHVVTWTGGAGSVNNYFTLNGIHYPVAEGKKHETIYSKLPVDPKTLKRGRNVIKLLSDTEHHGIEIFRPGPALMVEFSVD